MKPKTHDRGPRFADLVADELARARAEHPHPIANTHHGYAILLEEVDEFWAWVKLKRKDRLAALGCAELVQIAAMAQRIAEDCSLMFGAGYVSPVS